MIKRILLVAAILSQFIFATSVKNIDNGMINVSIKNHKANILSFPFFIKNAKIATDNPEDFTIKVTGDSILVIPNATVSSAKADLVVWSKDGYAYLIKIDIKGKDQYWNLTSNRVHKDTSKTIKFESGKIDEDIKRLFKMVITKNNIPGYKKVKVKRKFVTHDLIMQKDYMFDGAKYRVEKWYLKNRTPYTLKLDEGDFYTKGILAITFESEQIPPYKIGTMYLIINKASLAEGE